MRKIEELIREYCPNGVEYKRLGDIGRVAMCKRILKSETTPEGDVPFYKIGTFGKQADAYITKEQFEEYKQRYSYPKKGDILISAAGTIGRTVVFDGEPAYYQDSNIVWLEHDESIVLNKYLFYIYQTNPWHISNGGTIARLYNDNIVNAQIPLPPLVAQREIVHILDKFSLYLQELTAELTARRAQYEYYRDELLALNGQSKYDKPRIEVELADIATIKNGKDYKHLSKGNIPVYGSGGVMTYVDTFAYNQPSVLIPRKGSLDKLYYVDEPFWTVDTIFYTDIDTTRVIPKYLFYYLQSQHLERLNIAGGVPSLTQSVLNKVKVLLPSIALQNRIVEVLDNFDKICSDLKIGLPAEIEKRQQQYEYYRDKLLTFNYASDTIFNRQTDRQTGLIRLLQYVYGFVTVRLGDVLKPERGVRVVRSQLSENGKYCVYQNSLKPLGMFENYNCRAEMPFVISAGAAGEIGYSKEPFWAADDCLFIDCENSILKDRYLYYVLMSKKGIISSQVRRASIPRLSRESIENLTLMIPTLEEQERIIGILDNFDKIINDISEGLPAEIEARQKQYEYYRDKLLTFEKAE